jgi:hypothetical protein
MREEVGLGQVATYKKTGSPLRSSPVPSCASPLPLPKRVLHPVMSESSSIDKEKSSPEKTVAGSTVDVAAHAIAGKEVEFTPEQAARVRSVLSSLPSPPRS